MIQRDGYRVELLEVDRKNGSVYVSISTMPGRQSEGNRTMNLDYIEKGLQLAGWPDPLPDGKLHPIIVIALPFGLPERAWAE